ncbi:MAG TPA: helix-turn-helix transcriptional regulator [Bacteroidales bacterium]|jgi:transcriptional regulator with XRE-family HTH domain|nr:helix-turn-helix transcriptional regulator [Bacteroidales bacterium]HPB24869.1 helix-turn-helix transcriptional regulator [Bacteroidales bacterium]HPI29501.1 helix-turn-helix transcriptional regulator [Bacteroidales bacterium]HQN15604.1 helix-turn-helix transcriptional regulator [Bacteroidales bacterium]HQP15138.1 helix-turn-helix transcriptional regulator [Bacteroidales bacterium]
MIFTKLVFLLKEKKLTQDELAIKMKMSKGGLVQGMKNGTIQYNKLIEMSEILEVDPVYWLSENSDYKESVSNEEKKLIIALRNFIRKENMK